MEIYDWIDKNINEIKSNNLYKKYFSSIKQEGGIDVLMLFNPNSGIDLILTMGQIIKAIHFYGYEEENIKRFADKLPFNLTFELTREQSRKLLGQPGESGGGDFSFLYGVTPNWDKYFFESFSLHMQFSEDERTVQLITIDSLKYSDMRN